MALHVQAYTLYSSVRPYGAAVLVAAVDREGPQLYMIEPSGIYYVGAGAAPDGRAAVATDVPAPSANDACAGAPPPPGPTA